MSDFGDKLDVLINCAGVMNSKDFKLITEEEFDMVMHINVRVPLQLISLSAPYLSRT